MEKMEMETKNVCRRCGRLLSGGLYGSTGEIWVCDDTECSMCNQEQPVDMPRGYDQDDFECIVHTSVDYARHYIERTDTLTLLAAYVFERANQGRKTLLAAIEGVLEGRGETLPPPPGEAVAEPEGAGNGENQEEAEPPEAVSKFDLYGCQVTTPEGKLGKVVSHTQRCIRGDVSVETEGGLERWRLDNLVLPRDEWEGHFRPELEGEWDEEGGEYDEFCDQVYAREMEMLKERHKRRRTAEEAHTARVSGEVSAKRLRLFLDMLCSICDEALLVVEQEGLRCRMVDYSHVTMVDLLLASDLWDRWDFGGGGQIAFDLGNLRGFVRLGAATDSVSVEVDRLEMTMRMGNLSRKFLPLDDSDMTLPKIPSFDTTGSIPLSSIADRLMVFFKAAGYVGNHARFEIAEGVMVASTEEEGESVREKFPGATGEARSMFSLEYLEKVSLIKQMEAAEMVEDVRLCLGTDYPLKVTGKNITWMLAPRVEVD
ncbi:MAG: hypothetical protein PHU95_07285 [Candidatus Thermoplasmatota archaeon]|nr:hypothetical protein [Candidatus Thermoplasmatota archaeon]